MIVAIGLEPVERRELAGEVRDQRIQHARHDALAHRRGLARDLGVRVDGASAVAERERHRGVRVALATRLAGLDAQHHAMGVGVLLDDLDGARELHRHRAHLDLDLGLDRCRAGRLDDAAALDARHDALEVEDRREALVDRPRGRERVIELNGHGRFSSEASDDYRLRGCSPPGTHQLGPENGTLSVRTGRKGAAAKAGHDLLIRVTAWDATIEVGDGIAISLDADPTSLRVLEGTGGMQALDDDDRDNIRADDRRRGAAAAGHRVSLDVGGGQRRPDQRPGRADAGRHHATHRVRRRRRWGQAQRQHRHHAERLGHQAVLGPVRSTEGRRRGRGRARRKPAVELITRCRPSARRVRPRRRAAARRFRARTARRPRGSSPAWDRSSRATHAPLTHRSVSGGASSAMPASSCPFARIFSVALTIAAGAPSDGLVL